jgi:hypothetical protein
MISNAASIEQLRPIFRVLGGMQGKRCTSGGFG